MTRVVAGCKVFTPNHVRRSKFPLVLVTLKMAQGVGENRLQLAILEGYEGFANKNGHESENDETYPVDLLSTFSLSRPHTTSRGSRKAAEFHPHFLR